MRTELYDRRATKRAVNLSLNSDLVSRARAVGLNISALSERAIRDALAMTMRAKFDAEIAQALVEHEQYLEGYGSLAEAVRAMQADELIKDGTDAAE